MAGQYSHRQFFRKVPNQQLADYFASRQTSLSLDWDAINEAAVDEIFAAFSGLTEEQQGVMEAEFQDVNALACEAGIQALLDEASFHQDESFADELAAIDGLHAKVMWVLLSKPTYWRGATMFLHADNVSFSFWKKRNDLPDVPPNVDEADIQQLADGISACLLYTSPSPRDRG